MRVLITGGAGRVGMAVTRRLVERGWEVLVVGRRPDVAISGAEYAVCDITQLDDLRCAVQGCHAVVHLAAIASPRQAPGQEVFRVNALGTFNVFEAASAEGIGRVVQASSINAFGCFWSTRHFSPRYLPVDEAHPANTTDSYSFSKQVVEEIGAYYWRRERIASVALRFPGVWSASRLESADHRQRVVEDRGVVDALAAMAEDERHTCMAEIRRQVTAYRRRRPLEYGTAGSVDVFRAVFGDDALARLYAFDRYNLWTAIDERDAAQAVDKALSASFDGSHVLFVNDSQNWLGYDARALARLFFPEAAPREPYLRGPASLVNIDRARALIDFEPEHPTYPGGH